MTLLQAKNVIKTYEAHGDTDRVEVLRGVNLSLENGKSYAIVGSSGSGKSTLLHILGGLDKPTNGEVIFKNDNIASYSDEKITQFRNREIGFVFQFHHLLPEFTALENVMMPALVSDSNSGNVESRAIELLTEFGLNHRLHHRPSMLSGGEQQRVAVARALINNPSLLLADEPTGNLDDSNTSNLIDLLLQLQKDSNRTMVIVTHDSNIARTCDFTLIIQDGIIV